QPRRHARHARVRRREASTARGPRLHRQRSSSRVAIRGIKQAGSCAVVQLSQEKSGAPHHRRPPATIAARRYPTRSLASRVHNGTAKRPKRSRHACGTRTAAEGTSGSNLRRSAHLGRGTESCWSIRTPSRSKAKEAKRGKRRRTFPVACKRGRRTLRNRYPFFHTHPVTSNLAPQIKSRNHDRG